MKFSYNWLRELVDNLDTPPEALERLITLRTAECEGIEKHGNDAIIEVDNKSLTHRPDLWGHHGMAREVSAILRKKLLDPVPAREFTGPSPIHVDIESFDLCPRYSALVLENVTIQPSPDWLRDRLESVGINAVNNVVDVTNFVMAELAQPMHAFDADKLRGDTIFVRSATDGEAFNALYGDDYTLDHTNLIIADAGGPIALAGVLGGSPSPVSDSTTRIVLESANFNASCIRKTSSKLRLRTDASMRFEKAQDPVNTVRGIARAVQLLEQVSPGIRVVGAVADAYRPAPPQPPVVLPLDWLDRKLGTSLPAAQVREILEALEFKVEEIDARTFSVFTPTWRATKDVSIKDDLVEEMGRMVGYDSITPVAPLTPARVPPANPEREFHHHVREEAAAQGFTEVHNYSFVSEEMARAFSLDLARHVQVANPIAADHNLLRSSLLPGIWKNVRDNARHFDHFRFFEIGREIHPDREVPHFAAAVFAKDDGLAGLLELKRLAECLLPGVEVQPTGPLSSTPAQAHEHPHRAADILLDGIRLGRLFEFHPNMVETGRAAVLDLDLTLLFQHQPAAQRYQQLRRFPASAFDLSVVAAPRALIGEVEAQLKSYAGADLLSIAFVRDFTLPDGNRSLSYRLTVGASDRTLSSDEVGAIRARVIAGMQTAGYDLKV
ncbi:MAG TPA: phenylalanine--tRNA ligase subunit beta [Bryobacteraceae bacterium]